MKTIIHTLQYLAVMLLLPMAVHSQGIEITSGGNITNTGTTSIEIINGNFVNDGTYTKGNETVKFTNSSNKSFSGSSATTLYNLTLEDTANVSINNNITVFNNFTLKPKAKLTLVSGKSLNLDSLFIQSSTIGTATYVDQNTSNGLTINSGVNVQQYLVGGRNWYVSSPVASVSKTSVTTQGYSFWSYDEPTNSWTATDATFASAKGYILNKATTGNVTFAGTNINTNEITVNLNRHVGVTKAGYNLVGNPYPSYLDWTLATKNKIETSIWYRTKNLSGTYVFDTYNNGIGTNNNQIETVSAIIPPMQAFWVRVDSVGVGKGTLCSGNFTINKSMCSHQSGNNRLKSSASTTATQSIQQILRMQVSNGINIDEAIVLFNPNASNGYDSYDSPKMTNANVAIPEIYTKVGNENLVINGLNSIATNPSIPLGFTTGTANTFTIKASEIKNFDANTQIILIDNIRNTEQDLTNGAEYSFSSDKITTIDRFNIIFRTAGTVTGLDNTNRNHFLVYKNNNGEIIVNIEGNVNNQASVSIYNAVGQKLHSKQCTGATTVLNPELTPGVYYVSVNGEAGTMTKKILFN